MTLIKENQSITQASSNLFANYEKLNVYAEEGVTPVKNRPDALATISAGYKEEVKKDGKSHFIPRVSRDGTIYISDLEGRAPGLAKILKENKLKFLTVTPAFDDPKKCFQQHFTRRTATRLEVYGTKDCLYEIIPKGENKADHIPHPKGTPKFKALLKTCKIESSFYFYLADWTQSGEAVLKFPDGFGAYRLRFTSTNSFDNLMDNLARVVYFTGGRVAGIPFELRILSREVADPTGGRRKVPVWALTMKHPTQKELNASIVRQIMDSGIAEASKLAALPVPREETLEMLADEIDVDMDSVTLDNDDIKQLSEGRSFAFRRKQWHGMVKDTFLSDEQQRHDFLTDQTGYASLNDAIKYLEQGEWDDLLAEANTAIREHGQAEQEARSEAEFVQDIHEEVHADTFDEIREICKLSGLKTIHWLDFVGFVTKSTIKEAGDITLEIATSFLDATRVEKAGLLVANESKLLDLKEAFLQTTASDEAAKDVLG